MERRDWTNACVFVMILKLSNSTRPMQIDLEQIATEGISTEICSEYYYASIGTKKTRVPIVYK